MHLFLRRSTYRIIGTSSVPTLIKRLTKDSFGSVAHHAKVCLQFISKHCPAMYKLHVGELAKGISDERNEGLVEVCLQALAAVEAWDKGVAVSDK